MKKLLIVLLIPLLLSSCSEQKNITKTEENSKNIKNEQVNKSDEEKEVSATNDKKDSNKKQEQKKLTDEKLEEYSKKTSEFVQNIGEAYSIVYEEFYDYNFDKKMEAVVFVQDMDNITDVYFLNVDGEKAEMLSTCNILNLSDDNNENDLNYDSAGSFKIEGFDYPIPFVYFERDDRENGYRLYHIEDDYIDYFVDTTPVSDVGTTEFIDIDNDGDYDLYELNKWGYDVFYYPLKTRYKFDDESAEYLSPYLDGGSIELGECPENPIDIVKEYMFLSYIKSNIKHYNEEAIDIENLDERLKELGMSEINLEYIFSYELLKKLAMQIPDRTEIIEMVYESGKDASVRIDPSIDNEVDKEKRLLYVLRKENKKWKIVDIEFVE